MEIFQLLDHSNCRQCGEKTCLAFAGAVFKGHKQLGQCPKLDDAVLARYDQSQAAANQADAERDVYLQQLKDAVGAVDLAAAAVRLGGRFAGGKLTLKVFGKDFSIGEKGRLSSDIHINPWVAVPFLNHVLHGRGVPPSGSWRSFRELKDGRERYPLFQKRCEEALKRVADGYPDLFDDLVHIFSGRKVARRFRSDISVVLNPLPLVPLMICYWLPDEGLSSSLNLFFDRTAEENLDIGSVFTLGTGFAQMIEKLALRHGFHMVRPPSQSEARHP
jgi:hypothetical protein